MAKKKMPIYYSSVNALVGLIVFIYFIIFLVYVFNGKYDLIENASYCMLIVIVSYLIVVMIGMIRGKNIGSQCISYLFTNGSEIHVGTDATKIVKLKKILVSESPFKVVRRIFIKKKKKKEVLKYSDDVRVVYIQLVAERIKNALIRDRRAYIMAHTFIEKYLLDECYLNAYSQEASFINRWIHAFSQRTSASHSKFNIFYKIKIVKKHIVNHYEVVPTDEKIELLKVFENVEHAEKFVAEADREKEKKKHQPVASKKGA